MSLLSEQALVEEKREVTSSPASPLPQREAENEDDNVAENNVVEVRDDGQLVSLMGGFHCFFCFFFVISCFVPAVSEMSR